MEKDLIHMPIDVSGPNFARIYLVDLTFLQFQCVFLLVLNSVATDLSVLVNNTDNEFR